MLDIDRTTLIQKAIERHFVSWAYLEYSGSLLKLGAKFEAHVDELIQIRNRHVLTFEKYLSEVSDDELRQASGQYEIAVEGFGLHENELANLRNRALKEMPNRSRTLLIAIGAYPDELADYTHWALRDRFSNEELVWLSIGLEPVVELNEYFESSPSSMKKKGSELGIEANRRKDVFDRARDFDMFCKAVDIEVAYEWFSKVDLVAPKRFGDMLEIGWKRIKGEVEKQIPLQAPNLPDKKPDPREIRIMAKLITAIAIEEYGYVPNSKRSVIPGEIEEICDRNGLGVSRETVLKYLRIGAAIMKEGEDTNP